MLFSEAEIGKIYKVEKVVQNKPCFNCNPCLRLRLMEIGFNEGARVMIKKKLGEIWVVDLISEEESVEQTIGLRDNETYQIVLVED